MKKSPIFNEIINLLEEDEKTQVWLLDKIKAIMTQDGDRVFSNLLKVFTHLEIDPKEAEKTWSEILKHRQSMSKTLKRNVALRVAMLDYFISINRQIKNPKIIEIEIFEKIEKSLITDDLTGLYNKRFFIETLYREVQRSKRYSQDLSIMFIDIDDFKKCNDFKGHTFGDKVLRSVANIIRNALREVDYACRFGGDEFVVILPETRGRKAVIAAERLRRSVAKKNFLQKGKYHTTVSAGIATFGVDGNSPEELIENADTALFRAKNDGKNKVYIFFKEKREFARISADWNVSYTIVDKKTKKKAKIKNVGGGGLLFEDKKPLPISSIIEITFTPPFKRKQITATARVVRLEVKEKGTFDIGIFFLKIKPNDKKMIIRYAGQS